MFKQYSQLQSRKAVRWIANTPYSRQFTSSLSFARGGNATYQQLEEPIFSSISNYWNRCVSFFKSGSFGNVISKPKTEKVLQSAILNFSRSQPVLKKQDITLPPGIIRKMRFKIKSLREDVYRNVLPEFTRDEKRWLWRLIAANAGVLVLWQTAGNYIEGRQAMWQNFMVSIKSVRSGRLWVLLTSSLSNRDLITLAVTSASILWMGGPLLAAMGTAPFMGLYFLSGMAGGLAHMEYYAYPVQTKTPTENELWFSDHASFHSSGAAISGLAAYHATLWPTRPTMIGGMPVPAWALVGALTLFQIYRADSTHQAWQGNFGGLFVGLFLGLLTRGRYRSPF